MSETIGPKKFDIPESGYVEAVETINNEEKIREAEIRSRNKLDLLKDVTPTALPAIKFHMFSFCLLNPKTSDEEIEREIRKMLLLSEKEQSAIESTLPTMGVELEIPGESVPYNLKVMSNNLDVVSGYDGGGLGFYEFRPDFSYSAAVQARIIDDISRLVRFPQDDMPQGQYAPFHINIGIPRDVDHTSDDFWDQTHRLTLLSSASFISSERILKRQYHNTPFQTVPLKGNDVGKSNTRLEFRTPSFETNSVHRLLIDIQILAASMLAYCKKNQGYHLEDQENTLADIWSDLIKSVDELFKKHEIDNEDPYRILKAIGELKLTDPGFEREARSVFDKLAIRCKEALKPKSQT